MDIKLLNLWQSKSGKSFNFMYKSAKYTFKKQGYSLSELDGKTIKIKDSELINGWNMIRDYEIIDSVSNVLNEKEIDDYDDFDDFDTMVSQDESFKVTSVDVFDESLDHITPLQVGTYFTNSKTDLNWKIIDNSLNVSKEVKDANIISVIENFVLAKTKYKGKFASDPLVVMLLLETKKHTAKLKVALPTAYKKEVEANINEVNYWGKTFFKIAGKEWIDITEKDFVFIKSIQLHIIDSKNTKLLSLDPIVTKKKRYINFINKKSVKYKNLLKSKKELNEILKHAFHTKENNIKAFKDEQIEAIDRITSKEENALAVLKTGFGKSLIYQFITILQPRIFITIFPIRSLISDQSKTFTSEFEFNYSIDNEELKGISINKMYKETILNKRVFLVTPERLENFTIQKGLFSISKYIGYMVFDEAHTISEWGHDFRPSYLMAKRMLENLSESEKINTIALTATAAPHIQKDIAGLLDIKPNNIINIADTKVGLKREEITYDLIKIEDIEFDRWHRSFEYNEHIDGHILAAYEKYKQLIVFHIKSGSDKDFEIDKKEMTPKYFMKNNAFSSFQRLKNHINLNDMGLYTGKNKIINDEKIDNFLPFLDKKIIFATKSFGMGVNLRDCDYVLLTEPPYSLEDLYQQSGRVGRRGQKSTVEILLHDNVLLDPLSPNSPYNYFLEIDEERIMDQPKIMNKLINLIIDNDFNDLEINVSNFLGKNKNKPELLEWSIAHLITQFKIIDTYHVEYKGLYKSKITIRPFKDRDVFENIAQTLARLRIDNDGSLKDMINKYYDYYFAKLQQDKLIGINIFINKIQENDISSDDDSEMISNTLNEYYKTRTDESHKVVDKLFNKLIKEEKIEKIIDFLENIDIGIPAFDIMEEASRYEIKYEYIYLASLLISKVFDEKILAFSIEEALDKKYSDGYIKDNIYKLLIELLLNTDLELIHNKKLKETLTKYKIIRSLNE